MTVRFDLTVDDLFGNEAAEDEDERIFQSHLLQRNDLSSFAAASNAFRLVIAYKGQGKSSLLRSLAINLAANERALVVSTTGAATVPDVAGHDTTKWARAWKRELYKLIAVRVGAQIGIAWTDDAIGLVEESEKQGFRARSLFSAIFDRLKPSLKASAKVGSHSFEINGERIRLPTKNHEETLRRFLSGRVTEIWLIVDDIDRNFRATKSEKAKIVGFLDAVRDMRNSIPQLRVRASIRPNVHASVRLEFESISHIRQYLLPISWSEDQIRQMLARRIEGYLTRTAQIGGLQLPAEGPARDNFFISLLFKSPVRWGAGNRPIHVPLYTLSVGRPRWLVELCKRAAALSFAHNTNVITIEHVRGVMDDFGEARKSDLVAEFSAQCDQLADMFDAFHSRQEIYTTDELYATIEQEILSRFAPNIAGLSGRARAADVASFLFEVGLFNGRRDKGAKYEHFTYSHRPTTFKSAIPPPPDTRWEIHPAFRTVLGMRPAS